MNNGVNVTEIGKELLKGNLNIGQLWTSLKERMSDTTLSYQVGRCPCRKLIQFVVITTPEQLANHYANEERNSDNDMDEIKLFWQQSLSSLEPFQSLAGQIQTCISKIIDDRTGKWAEYQKIFNF